MIIRRRYLLLPAGLLLLGLWFGGEGTVDLGNRLAGPGIRHIFGTDELGRDLFARWWMGGARALLLGLCLTSIHVFSGTLAAVLAHPAPWLRRALLALADAVASVPSLLLSLFLLAWMRPGYGALALALAAGGWIPYARLVLVELDALEGDRSLLQARLLGAGPLHVFLHHKAPRLGPLLLAQAGIGVGAVILVEGGLSFLGLGLPPESASWGSMLAAGRVFLPVGPWQVLWPSLGLLAVLWCTEARPGTTDVRN